MRNIERDTQAVHISRYEDMVAQVDEDGRLTGKNVRQMSTPAAFYPSVSIARGEAQGTYFGVNLDYDRVLTIDEPEFEVSEADVLWIDAEPADAQGNQLPHDHVIKKVSRKGDYTVIAAKRVEVRS